MIKTVNKMFQSEMENLELGLNLGPSDLLFSDDLLNIPLDRIQDAFGVADEEDLCNTTVKNNKNEFESEDVLEKIITEVQLPSEVEDDLTQSLWSSSMSLFEDASCSSNSTSQFFPNSPGSESNSSSSSDYSADDTQALIHEMEQFLSSHEIIKKQPQVKAEIDEDKNAEAILDALISGNINSNVSDPEDSGYFDDSFSQKSKAILNDSIKNVSQIVTEDGNRIMIIITNDDESQASSNSSMGSPTPSSTASSFVSSPASYSLEEDQDFSSDPEWSPSPASSHLEVPRRGTKRSRSPDYVSDSSEQSKKSKRGPYKKKGRYGANDRKERKKMQNVVAARRYRDKKKSEQQLLDQEEQELIQENKKLKNKLNDIEGEVKTLKNLMLELGLVKLNVSA